MGIIAEKGSAVKNLEVGMKVAISFCIACGECDYCKRGEFSCCNTTNDSKLMETMYGHRTSAIFGYSHLTGGVPGSQAEWVRVPYADVNCLPIPDDVPDEKALYLTDIIPTSYHGTWSRSHSFFSVSFGVFIAMRQIYFQIQLPTCRH